MSWGGIALVLLMLWLPAGETTRRVVTLPEEGIAFELPIEWQERNVRGNPEAKAKRVIFAAQNSEEGQALTICRSNVTRGVGSVMRRLERQGKGQTGVKVSRTKGMDGTTFVLAEEKQERLTLSVAAAQVGDREYTFIYTSEKEAGELLRETVESFRKEKDDRIDQIDQNVQTKNLLKPER